MNKQHNYRVGSIIKYRAFGGEVRTVEVESKEADIKDGRAGFDGILAGLLVAQGGEGLENLRSRGLFAANTRPVDARHALAALRFAWESLADRLPRDLVATATADLLLNPAVAADCAIDLARYGRWNDVDRVAALWETLGRDDPLVRRAVAGYLAACPLDAARRQRERLAAASLETWPAAEAAAGLGDAPACGLRLSWDICEAHCLPARPARPPR